MKRFYIFLILIFIVIGAIAQAPPPAPEDTYAPIGENLLLLLITGICYFIVFLYKMKNNKQLIAKL